MCALSRWLRPVACLLLASLAAICLPTVIPMHSAPLVPETEAAAAEAFPIAEARIVSTPTPGPAPTSTPQALVQPDTDQAAELTRKGEALFLQSDLAGAEAAFIDAIAADPGHLPGYVGLTRVYLYQSQYWQQALAAAGAAQALAPEDPTVLAYLAWALQMAHHFDDARSTAMHAVELDPENALAHAALADVLISVYEVDAALDHARQAVELDDQSAMAWSILGYAEDEQHNWEAAAAAHERALELEPKFFAWHLARAHHELNTTGDAFSARETAEPALESQPDHAWSLSFLVDLAIEMRDWEAAESACVQLMALDQLHTPYPDPYLWMATVMLLQERFSEAEDYQILAEERAMPERRDATLIRMRLHNERYECQKARALAQEWLDERPYSVHAMRMIGVSYLCDDDYEQAAAHFRQAYEVLPRSVADARLLAVAYARDGKASEAVAVLNEVKPFALEDPLYYQALYEVYLGLGKRREALRAAQRWQVVWPHDTTPRVSIALVHLLLDDLAAARGAAESALAEGESSATLYTVLGQTLYRQGDPEKAEEYLVQAVKRNENHYLARDLLANFYISQNECDKALPHLRWLLERATDEERASDLARAVAICEGRSAARPTPHPDAALDDDAALEEANARVRTAGAEPLRVDLTEANDQWALVVSYSTALEVDTEEFAQLERRLALDLARLLPRIASQPDALLLVSGSGERVHNLTLIPTWSTILWIDGQLTDEEFEETWHRQQAAGSE